MDPLQVNIHEAKTQLSKLIQAALNGREVIIARGNKPIVRLEVLPQARGNRKIGNAKGLIYRWPIILTSPSTTSRNTWND